MYMVRSCLKCMQHALTQQGKFCPAIHHTLEEFELVYLSFNQAIVLGQGEPEVPPLLWNGESLG